MVRELQDILMPGDKATFGDWAECTGTDFQHKLLEVEIGELIFGGTIAVNDQFETSVPGPVSYTHLDVYKREGQGCGLGIVEAAQGNGAEKGKIVPHVEREAVEGHPVAHAHAERAQLAVADLSLIHISLD